MGSWDWKNDKRLHAAIGVAVVVLALKWMFTDSLLRSVEVLQGNVTRDQWDNNVVTSVPVSTFLEGWLPLIYDGVVWLLVAVGSRVLFGAISGYTAVKSLVNKQSVVASVESQSVAIDEVAQGQKLVADFVVAAQKNLPAQLEECRVQLRKPEALFELNEAYEKGDLEKAALLSTELQSLIGPVPVAVPKKRASSNA